MSPQPDPSVDAIHPVELVTPRLRLRQWQDGDVAPFAAMGQDPEVMAWFPGLLSPAESAALVARCREMIARQGWGFWAVEVCRDGAGGENGPGPLAGWVGLNRPRADLPCMPCVEVGWRLARRFWGQGYALEAARAALAFGFTRLALPEIVAFTALGNTRSRALMARLAMVEDVAGSFEHPALPAGHPLSRHCLYRLSRAAWAGQPSP